MHTQWTLTVHMGHVIHEAPQLEFSQLCIWMRLHTVVVCGYITLSVWINTSFTLYVTTSDFCILVAGSVRWLISWGSSKELSYGTMWPNGWGAELKCNRSGVQLPLLAKCRSILQTSHSILPLSTLRWWVPGRRKLVLKWLEQTAYL